MNRQQKYANILEENPEPKLEETNNSLNEVISLLEESPSENQEEEKVVQEEIKEEKEIDKLSMTREIKFKDLQEQIEKDEKAATQEIVLDDIPKKKRKTKASEETIEEAIIELEDKPKKRKPRARKKAPEVEEKKQDSVDDITITKIDLKKINEIDGVKEKDLEKTINDDLYLTTAFKPVRKRVKKVVKKFFAFVLTVLILVALGLFVVVPLYKKYTAKPKAIFETSIDTINKNIKEYIDKDVLFFDYTNSDIKISLNTNDDKYKALSKYDGINIYSRNDIKNNESLFGVEIKDHFQRTGFNYYYLDDEAYYEVLDSDLILSMDETKYINPIKDSKLLSKISNNKKEDIKYLLDKSSSIIKEIIPESKLTKKSDKVTVNSKDVNVIRHTLELDASSASQITNEFYTKVLADNKCAELLASLNDMTVNEYKTEVRNITYDSNFKAKVNIYVKNGNEFVGFDIEINGFRYLYYYVAKDFANFYINLGINKEEAKTIEFIQTKEDSKDKILVKYNNRDYLTLKVNEYNNENVNVSYETLGLPTNITGDLIIKKLSRNEQNISLTINNQSNYYNFNASVVLKDEPIIFNTPDNEEDKKDISKSTETKLKAQNAVIEICLEEMNIKDEVENVITFIEEKFDIKILDRDKKEETPTEEPTEDNENEEELE